MIRAILALLASLLTAVQAIIIYTKGQTICFNNGCAIVDSMTTVSPLYFNLAGLVFFQILFWCLLWGRDGSEHWHKFARLLLLAGLAAEAVLVFFQYAVAGVFCSYCIVIFAFIVLMNILSGPRQIIRGIIIFAAVTVTCFSLQFGKGASSGESLDKGSMAMVTAERNQAKLYLFFSSTCAHCEKILDVLRAENKCTLRFNPIERIDKFAFPGLESFAEYDPEVNISFMKSLSISEIPVLVAVEQKNTLILKGEQRIREYLDSTCLKAKEADYSGTSSMEPAEHSVIPGLGGRQNDACSVDTDCDTGQTDEAAGKK